jgi:hypothetical protein
MSESFSSTTDSTLAALVQHWWLYFEQQHISGQGAELQSVACVLSQLARHQAALQEAHQRQTLFAVHVATCEYLRFEYIEPVRSATPCVLCGCAPVRIAPEGRGLRLTPVCISMPSNYVLTPLQLSIIRAFAVSSPSSASKLRRRCVDDMLRQSARSLAECSALESALNENVDVKESKSKLNFDENQIKLLREAVRSRFERALVSFR